VPVVCALHGACVGAGLDLATACDVRWCAADAAFSVMLIDRILEYDRAFFAVEIFESIGLSSQHGRKSDISRRCFQMCFGAF